MICYCAYHEFVLIPDMPLLQNQQDENIARVCWDVVFSLIEISSHVGYSNLVYFINNTVTHTHRGTMMQEGVIPTTTPSNVITPHSRL